MKSFRLPRLPARSPGAPRLFTRARLKFYLLGLGLMLLSFLVSLYLFFPASALKERIEQDFSQRTTGSLNIGQLSLLFPPGLRAQQVRVNTGLPERPTVDIAAATLQPLWLSLLGSNPGVAFQASLLGGNISGRARRNGALEAQVRQLAFAEHLTAGSDMELAGTLGEGTFTGIIPPPAGSESQFALTFDSLQLKGLDSLGVADGNLNLGRISLKGSGRGNTFRIEQLEATGGEMQASGSGSVLLNQPLQRSRLNLNLVLRPGANFDRNLRDLLDLFAKAGSDGAYHLRLTGTLSQPILAK